MQRRTEPARPTSPAMPAEPTCPAEPDQRGEPGERPSRRRVLVPGSISVDVTSFSAGLPAPGETIIGQSLSIVQGGKGANQCLAAALAGADAAMIGCVGDDAFAAIALAALRRCGADVTSVTTVPGPTGIAHIRVDTVTGQNEIVVIPLANGALTAELAERWLREAGAPGDVVLLQLEIPVDTTVHLARVAHALGMRIVLDPAPAARLPDALWPLLSIVTPNESEATTLTGLPVTGVDSARAAGRWFVDRGVAIALVTLAERGVVEVTADGDRHYPAPPVQVVDTTAAGDAFTGNLAAALANGLDWAECLSRAIGAGALAVTVPGASSSLPAIETTLAFLDRAQLRRAISRATAGQPVEPAPAARRGADGLVAPREHRVPPARGTAASDPYGGARR